MTAFPHWVTPTPSYYFNGRRWNNDLRKDYAHLEKDAQTYPVNSKDNSNSSNNSERQNSDRKKTNSDKILLDRIIMITIDKETGLGKQRMMY